METLLAQSSRHEIVRDGHVVYFRVRRGNGRFGQGSAAAVVGCLALLAWAGTFWIGWRGINLAGPAGWSAAMQPLISAVVLTVLGVALWRGRSQGHHTQAPPAPPFLAADLQHAVVLDARGNVIAPINEFRAVKTMLLTSSASSLELHWAGRTKEVFRGSVWGTGSRVSDVLSLLHQMGFSR